MSFRDYLNESKIELKKEENRFAEDKTFKVFVDGVFKGWVGDVGDGWDYRPSLDTKNYKNDSGEWSDTAEKTKLTAAKKLLSMIS